MKPDRYLDELIQPIINLYNQMEYELIIEIAKRFKGGYDGVSGALEWQLQKLKELGGLNQDAIKIIAKYSKLNETVIMQMLNDAGLVNVEFAELAAQGLKVTPEILRSNPALKATFDNTKEVLGERYKKIETKALESVRGQYINILNKAYLGTASGTFDIATSIKKAVKEMAQNGIEGATYHRGDVTVRYSIEGTVRRDTITAVNQCANSALLETAKAYNCEAVEVSQHLGARVSAKNPIANHYGWQGKVYKIKKGEAWAQDLTGTTELEQKTGYGDIEGLSGVNCRHRMFLFFEGFSKPKKLLYNEEENKKAYELSQKQRKLERDIRGLKKQIAAMQVLESEEANKKFDEINQFCKANGLNRDYQRELVIEQIK